MVNKLKIVIAEDDKFISLAYTAGLKDENFEVITASDGEEALLKIRQSMPDIVLLDLIMPLKTGFDVLEELKNDPLTKDIPIVAFSNLGQKTDIDRAYALGAVEYINKDELSMSEVIKKIRNILSLNS